ncbi:MAG TPA: hypothetical protein VLK30_09210 [Candidatus Limnocylindrales bacterium]|nr:hypothetical protein [Candidatus Limnocylindrales bacterium]
MYPVPLPPAGRTEGRNLASLLLAVFGLLLAMTGLLLGAIAVLIGSGDLLDGLLLGLPAMASGAVAYFLGRSAIGRIAESPATLGGRPTAVAGWIIGSIGAAVGALSALVWIVLLLLANFGPPPA